MLRPRLCPCFIRLSVCAGVGQVLSTSSTVFFSCTWSGIWGPLGL